MKRALTLLALTLCFGVLFGQDKELRHVIVVMANQFNENAIVRQTQFMDKTQRRALIIGEHQIFCQASQQEVLRFVEGMTDKVQDIQPFWVFNGFGCWADEEAIRQIEAHPDVALVYQDELRKMIPDNGNAHEINTKGNGWHVDKVNAPLVWSYNGTTGYTGNGIVVALLDSGVNYNHIDIAGSMWDGGSEFPNHGYDFINNDNDPMDDFCHGTHCAGIVAGQGNAGTQTGIAPGAKIMAIKVMDDTGYGADEQLYLGIEFALQHGADILSCSFGDPEVGSYAPYRQVYETVLDAGVIASVAAGNVGDTQYTYPIPYNIEAPGNCPPPWLHPDQLIEGGRTAVVCVGATNSNDERCGFSSVGPVTWADGNSGNYNDYPYANGDASRPGLIRPDIAAPGKDITSLNYANNTGYVQYDGTSMATPCVAGVMALLLEADPSLTPTAIDSIIELTATRAGNNKKDNRVGAGRIDALAAIDALFFHGPTNLTANLTGSTVALQWEAPADAATFEVYRDGLRIANNITETTYIDHLTYANTYTYYVTAVHSNGFTTLPSNYVRIVKEVEIEAEVINNQRVALSWNMPNNIVDGFESGDFYQNMWLNDATSPWVITNNNPNSGNYCAKSTNQGMFSTSSLGLAVNVPATSVVSYYANISCFPLNGGGFFIDNVQQGETIKDEVPWTQYSFALSPGNHLLEWKYGNQLSEGDYENVFYIDDITVGSPFKIYRDDCSTSNPELIAENVAVAQYVDYGWDELPIGQYKYGISNDNGFSIAWSDCLDKTVMTIDETPITSGIKRITIFNTLGQVVYDANTDTDCSVSVLRGFPAGIYIVRMLTDQGLVTRKAKN